MTTSYDVARELVAKVGGNPSNTSIVRAVAIWLRFESGSTIFGNNPWNMRPGNEQACKKGVDGKGFVIYCTLSDGLSATAQRLNANDWRNYRPISNAIRANNPIGFFVALAGSKWSSDRYGGGSKLINAFRSSLGYNYVVGFRNRDGGTVGQGTTVSYDPNADNIKAAIQLLKDAGVSVDPTHTLTAEEIRNIITLYWTRHNEPPFLLESAVTGFVNKYSGKTVATYLQDIAEGATVQGGGPFDAIAGAINNVAGAFGFLGDIAGFLLDPENWLYMGALAVGGILTAYGARTLIAATGEPVTEAKTPLRVITTTKRKGHQPVVTEQVSKPA